MASNIDPLNLEPIPVKTFVYRDYECQIMKNPWLALCGYAILPAGHPMNNKPYDDIDVDVHSGLTFGGKPFWKESSEDRFAVGFDCAHPGDILPGMASFYDGMLKVVSDPTAKKIIRNLRELERGGTTMYQMMGDTYKDEKYVTKEIKKMVDQLIELDDR